jgi:hypothetical protein
MKDPSNIRPSKNEEQERYVVRGYDNLDYVVQKVGI